MVTKTLVDTYIVADTFYENKMCVKQLVFSKLGCYKTSYYEHKFVKQLVTTNIIHLIINIKIKMIQDWCTEISSC